MKAKAHLEEAIVLNPEFAEAYYKLGLLFKKEEIGRRPSIISGRQSP